MTEYTSYIQEAGHNLPRLYISTLFLRSAFGVVTLLLPFYLDELNQEHPEISFSGIQIGLIVGSIFVAEISLVTFFGHLSDVVRRRVPFIVVGNVIAAVSLMMFSFTTSFVGLFTAHLVEGVGAAMVTGPALAMIGDSSKPEDRGRVMGIFETMTFGGMAVGFLVAGLLYDLLGGIDGFGRYTFAVSSLFLLAGAFFGTQLHEPHKKTLPEELRLIKLYFRETVPHIVMLTNALVIYLITITVGSVIDLLDGAFTVGRALLASGVPVELRSIFLGASAVMFVIGLIDWLLELREVEGDLDGIEGISSDGHFKELAEALRHGDLKKILPAWFFVMTLLGTIVTFLPIILANGIDSSPTGENLPGADETISKGLEASSIGMFFVLGISILGVSQVFFGKLVDRWGRRPVLLIGVTSLVLLSAEIVFAVTLFPSLFSSPFQNPLSLFYIILASITGLGVSAFAPAALAVLADNSDETNRGTTSGVYSLLLALGHLTGDLIGGVLWDLGQLVGGNRGAAIFIFLFCLLLATGAYLIVVNIRETSTLDNSED